jgi:hypothetical protein
MAGQTEVRESHEQLSEAWALDARAGGVGEVVDMVAEALAPPRAVIRRFKTGHASAPENRPPGGGYWVEESSSSDLRARGFGSVRAVCAGLPVGGGIAAA